MSKAREAVEALIHAAIHERDALSDAVRADANDKELQGRIADYEAGRGEYADGGFFPHTGTAKLIDSFTPRYGCGAFDKAYQWACELVRTTPAASVDLPKLEAVHKAHHDYIEACRGVAARSRRMMPFMDDHCDALNQLALTFALYMPFPIARIDRNDPYAQIAVKAATLADMYPVVHAETHRLSSLCDTKEGRDYWLNDLKAAGEQWDELERERKLLFALMVKHMPTEAKALRVISQGGRWSANDKAVDITAAVGELRGVVVDARRQIGRLEAGSEQPKATPADDAKPTTKHAEEQPATNGYVAHPADPTAYIPATEIIAKESDGLGFTLTPKMLGELVERFTEHRVRWTRPISAHSGKPQSNRRSVHLTDWRRYVKRFTGGDSPADGWPVMDKTEIESRTAKFRAGKSKR